MLDLSLSPFGVEAGGNISARTSKADSLSDSPMSDPPPSPSIVPAELLHSGETPRDVDAAPSSPYIDDDPESDDVLRMESFSQRGPVRHQKIPYRKRSHVSDDEERDELDIIGSGSPSPTSRPRPLPRSRHQASGRELRSSSVSSQMASDKSTSQARRTTRSSRQPSSPPENIPSVREPTPNAKSPTPRPASPYLRSPARSLIHLSPLEHLSVPVPEHATSPSHPSPLRQTFALPDSESFEQPPEVVQEGQTTKEELVDDNWEEDEVMAEAGQEILVPASALEPRMSPFDFPRRETSKRVLRASPDLSEPLVAQEPSRPQEYVIPAPKPRVPGMSFVFEDVNADESMSVDKPASAPSVEVKEYDPGYTLPAFRMLPPEFHRRDKPTRQQRKKERDKNGNEKIDSKKEEWSPMGMMRLGAVVRANPLWKRVARATKYLSTQDWTVSSTLYSAQTGVISSLSRSL